MARILVVGASVLQVPMVLAAKARGHWVAVADRDPRAVGIAFADRFFPASTIDEEALVEAAREVRAEAIVTMATDQPLCAMARAQAALGLAGMSYETALRATRKDLQRETLAAAGVPCPRFLRVRCEEDLAEAWEELSPPVIVKPVDSSGSRGVTLVETREGLGHALAHALGHSRGRAAVAEEFLVGRELSVETLSVEGRLHVLQVTEKVTTGPPHFVESGHAQPARLSEADHRAIEDIAAAAARALGITSGPTHTEVMLTAAGPRIVEVGARLGGDYITSDLVPLSTGIDMVGLTLDLALGRQVAVPEALRRGAAIRYFFPPPGKVAAVEGVANGEALPGVVRIEIFRGVAGDIVPVTGSHERAGYVISQGSNVEEAIAVAEHAVRTVRFAVTS